MRAAGDKAAGVDIPKDQNVVATYPIASTRVSESPAVGKAFIAFLTSAEGQAIKAKDGFGKP